VTVTVLVAAKLAMTVLLDVMLTLHTEPLRLVQPVHVRNLACGPATGVSRTVWPFGNVSLQSPGQLMPIGLLVTELTLARAPVRLTVR